jgi:hypothetical protein
MWAPDDFNADKEIRQEEEDFRRNNYFPTSGPLSKLPPWFLEKAKEGQEGLSFLAMYALFPC